MEVDAPAAARRGATSRPLAAATRPAPHARPHTHTPPRPTHTHNNNITLATHTTLTSNSSIASSSSLKQKKQHRINFNSEIFLLRKVFGLNHQNKIGVFVQASVRSEVSASVYLTTWVTISLWFGTKSVAIESEM